MLHRLSHAIRNNRTIVSNIFSLGTLQIFSYILPLITLPYITRVIGPEKYGIIAFAGAFVAYFLIFVNYGFNFTATRDISANQTDNKKISEIFWNVMIIKLGLAIIATFVGIILILSFEMFYKYYIIYIFSLLAIIGEILFPVWLFQGMEKMKYITIINVIIKSLFLIPIFVFIQKADDYFLLPLFSSLSSIFIGVIAFAMSINVFKIQFVMPSLEFIRQYLADGWYVFTSIISYGIYAASTIFILGIFTNNTVVGYYASAERILQASKSMVGIFSQSIYPSIAKKIQESKELAISFLKRVTILLVLISSITGITLFFGSELIVYILLGNNFSEAVIILQILALTLLVYGYTDTGGILTLLNFGYKKEFQKVMILRTIFFIASGLILCYFLGAIGIALGVLLSETFLSILVWYELRKRGINLLPIKKYFLGK